MLRSSLLSADCNSIFLLRFSHENLPNLSFLNRFTSMFYSHCPLSACTHFFTDTCYLFTYFWQPLLFLHTPLYVSFSYKSPKLCGKRNKFESIAKCLLFSVQSCTQNRPSPKVQSCSLGQSLWNLAHLFIMFMATKRCFRVFIFCPGT